MINSTVDVAERLMALEADPAFLELEASLTKTNALRILGTTETERWHSAFWSWVFDPRGSHGQGDFALKRLLTLMSEKDGRLRAVERGPCIGKDEGDIIWTRKVDAPGDDGGLSIADLMELRVEASLAAPGPDSFYKEVSLDTGTNTGSPRSDDSRLDGLIVVRARSPRREDPFAIVVLLEFKVKDRYKPEQLERYAKWLFGDLGARAGAFADYHGEFADRLESLYRGCIREGEGKGEAMGALFAMGGFVAKLLPSADRTTPPEGLEPPWSPLTYEHLIKVILDPMGRLPGIDAESKNLIRSYVDMAANPNSDITSQASEQQRKLVLSFLEKHRETMQILVSVLEQDGTDEDLTTVLREHGLKTNGGPSAKKKTISPQELLGAGLLRMGQLLIHTPTNSAGFSEQVVAKVVAPENGACFLERVSGGGVIIDGARSAGGLLRELYQENGGRFQDSGFRAWRVADGPNKGRLLADLADEIR